MDQHSALADQHVYAPPRAIVRDAEAEPAAEFYVVSARKFLLLYVGTFGLYQFYWCWKHWTSYRLRHREKMLPVARSVFALFFAHALNARIGEALQRDGVVHRWSPGALATAFVAMQIASGIISRLAWKEIGSPRTDVANIALMLPLALVMLAIQRAANAACGDPRGDRNARLGMANAVWLVLGTLFWLLTLIGLVLIVGDVPVDVALPQ